MSAPTSSPIPEDIAIQAGDICGQVELALTEERAELAELIARALLSEREKATKAEREASEHRVKDFWQQWARKRLEIQREHWLRAAKSALSGDMRDLRNRVELAEAPPIELVLSEGS